MLTQGHQQKYSTDTEQPSNTWEERVVNVDGVGGRGREGPTANVHIPLLQLVHTLRLFSGYKRWRGRHNEGFNHRSVLDI